MHRRHFLETLTLLSAGAATRSLGVVFAASKSVQTILGTGAQRNMQFGLKFIF